MEFFVNGLESITELYRIGKGPSSSHTMGPEFAANDFKKAYQKADAFKIILYSSLSKTGKGHGTDVVIKNTFAPIKAEVVFDYQTKTPHPNTLDAFAYKNGVQIGFCRYISVGGGKILKDGENSAERYIYPHTSFKEIKAYLNKNQGRLSDYADSFETADIDQYLLKVYSVMKQAIISGLGESGTLPGGLNVKRRAGILYNVSEDNEEPETKKNRLICAYAFAVAEQNAAYKTIVTAPTCGASGVLPAVLYYEETKNNRSSQDILRALKAAGIIGTLIKKNGSISGAECGCQAEIGSACAMAAAALSELYGYSLDIIEYAAEIAIEHHLGLTCDPICGLVQIPCIERNAVAAVRAVNAVILASFLSTSGKISFDNVVKAMKETGKDLSSRYKETAEGGLATLNLDKK